MKTLQPLLEELSALYGLMDAGAYLETSIPEVKLFGTAQPMPRRPYFYQPGIIIIGQGHKIGYLGNDSFRYDSETYLVLSVPISFECETFASAEEPLLGIAIDASPDTIRDLVFKIGDDLPLEDSMPSGPIPRGVQPAKLDARMADATERLLQCLKDPLESKALGKSLVNEIVFRVLLGPHGRALRMLMQQHTPYARVARAMTLIHSDYSRSLDVPVLAREAAMSPSAFHRAFKQVTGQSPIQYIKSAKLHRAYVLMTQAGMKAGVAASQVGYSSASQFSREFKRYFDVSPREVRAAAHA